MNERTHFVEGRRVRIAWSDEDECFIATVPSLPGCSAAGDNEAEAIREIGHAIRAGIAAHAAAGNAVAPPDGIPPMVHAVAEAMRAKCLETFGSVWSYNVSWAIARAAIEAMREPTDSMAVNGGLELEEQMFEQQGLVFDGAKAVFQRMVDAALAEPTAPR